uniref:Twisted gastrulation protein n=1 Tax=Meara stichopi TaxID=84115 RepID=A0A2P1DVC5_9BILA|nr:twisted gastrulation protein [Meara stichopi]
MMNQLTASTLCFLTIYCIIGTFGCNENYCAGVVSKCMIQEKCKCNYRADCSCCAECMQCVGAEHWHRCCDCLQMCPSSNNTVRLSAKSSVEELEPSTNMPSLFNVMAHQNSYAWKSFSYPIYSNPKVTSYPEEMLEPNIKNHYLSKSTFTTKIGECTVIYFDKCRSMSECKDTCVSVGSAAYRMFHNGCCECVGNMCEEYGMPYGKNALHCRDCLEDK